MPSAQSPDAAGGDVTLAVLAGGRASRLGGRDKGLQPLGGRPLVAHVLEAAAAMRPAAVLIVANRNAAEYARHAPTIADDLPDFRGPLAGVAAALRACPTPWLATVPVDCPAPPPDLLDRLLAAARRHGAAGVVAHDGERRQPLFALYRRALADSAAGAAAEGEGVWPWQDAIGAHVLDFSDRRPHFANLNTPEDFAAHEA